MIESLYKITIRQVLHKTCFCITLLFILIANAEAQTSIQVQYIKYNLGTNDTATLHGKGSESLFYIRRSLSGRTEVQKTSKGSIIKDKEGFSFYINSAEKRLVTREIVFRDAFLMENEPLEKPDWKIGTEQKNIKGYLCTKATALFRGRNFEVWYTTRIPVSYGPWLLWGLPGLIIEARSQDGDLSFEYLKHSIPDKSGVALVAPSSGQKMSRKDFLKKREELSKKAVEVLSSGLKEQGMKVEASQMKRKEVFD